MPELRKISTLKEAVEARMSAESMLVELLEQQIERAQANHARGADQLGSTIELYRHVLSTTQSIESRFLEKKHREREIGVLDSTRWATWAAAAVAFASTIGTLFQILNPKR